MTELLSNHVIKKTKIAKNMFKKRSYMKGNFRDNDLVIVCGG